MATYVKNRSISFPSESRGRSWLDGWTAPPAETVTQRVITCQRVLNGDRMPNWKSRIKAGQDATTNMTAVFDTIEALKWGKITQRYRYNARPAWVFTAELAGDVGLTNNIDLFGPIDPVQPTTAVDNIARGIFYNKLASITKSFDGLVFAKELRETLSLLRNPTKTLNQLAQDFLGTLRKRKRTHPRTWKRDISSAWLEQSFGWKPAINDAMNIVATFERLTPAIGNVKRVVAGASKMYDTSSSLPSKKKTGGVLGSVQNSGLVFDVYDGRSYETVTVRYRAGVIVRTEAPKWYSPELWGFDPSAWVPSAWEMLPWSFLVDYALNVGSVLNAVCVRKYDYTFANYTLVQKSYIHRVLKLREKDQLGISLPSYTYIGTTGDVAAKYHNATRKRVTRSVISGVPLPELQFSWDFTDGQLLNVAALLGAAGDLHPQNTPRRFRR